MQAGPSRNLDDERDEGKSKPKFDFGSDFSEIITTDAFVDKTMLIKRIIEDKKTVVISAPRRFGKSTNMGMVKRFLEIEVDERGNRKNVEETSNYKLFKDNEAKLEICKDVDFFNEHFGKYPVMYMDFMLMNTINCYDSMLAEFRQILLNLYTEHKYLLYVSSLWAEEFYIEDFKHYLILGRNLKLTERQIKHGFKYLAKLLRKYYNRQVFLMIDEYDSVVSSLITNDVEEYDYEDILTFVHGIILGLIQDNANVNRAFLTGCSHMIGNFLCPDGENIGKYSFLRNHPFVPFYGFTSDETKRLLEIFNLTDKSGDVEEWYGGYKPLHNDDIRIYSTWSVINYLKNKSFKNYWADYGIISNLRRILGLVGFMGIFYTFINGNHAKLDRVDKVSLKQLLRLKDFINILPSVSISMRDVYLFFQLLSDGGGYFNVIDLGENYHTLKAPNREIKSELSDMLYTAGFYRSKTHGEQTYNFNMEYRRRFLLKMASLEEGDKISYQQLKTSLEDVFWEIDHRHHVEREANRCEATPLQRFP